MLPELHIGPLTIATYPLMYALGVLVGGTWAYKHMRRQPGDPTVKRNALLLMIAATLLGLYIPAWIFTRAVSLFSGLPPEPVRMRVYYGLACGLLAVFFYCRAKRMPLLEPLDRLIPAFALGFAIARLGCLAAGCCGGAVTTSPFSLYLPDEAGVWARRVPTQILSGLFEFALFLGLHRFNLWRHQPQRKLPAWLRADGLVFFLYLFCFCLERFVLEFYRQDYSPLWHGLSQPHLWMLAGMFFSLSALIWQARRMPRGSLAG